MIQILDRSKSNVFGIKLSGKLHDADYRDFVPAVDTVIKERGTIRMLCQFADFHGWDLHALWDDIKFDVTHYACFERVAVVGDNSWEKLLAQIFKPFTKAQVRFFSDLDAAWRWLEETA